MGRRRSRVARHVARLSRIGCRGGSIRQHRSLRRLPFPRPRFAVLLLLPLACNALFWLLQQPISQGWAVFFHFWRGKLALAGEVSRLPFGPAWLELSLATLQLDAGAPSVLGWWLALALTLLLLILSLHLGDRLLPLRYLLRFGLLVQLSAQLFFAVAPDAFPYRATDYLRSVQDSAVWLLLLVPWAHALIYYIFDFSLPQKVALTLLTLAFIVLAIPCQIMLHAWLLATGSLLLMPLLYFVFGVWPLMVACVALYGWAMSWPRGSEQAEAGA